MNKILCMAIAMAIMMLSAPLTGLANDGQAAPAEEAQVAGEAADAPKAGPAIPTELTQAVQQQVGAAMQTQQEQAAPAAETQAAPEAVAEQSQAPLQESEQAAAAIPAPAQTTGTVVNAVQEVMAPTPPPPAEPREEAAAGPVYLDSMPSDEVTAEIADSSKPEPVNPDILLTELIDEYQTSGMGRVFLEKMDRQELFYTTATAIVNVKSNRKNWVDHRVEAYREAILDAQAQYIEFLSSSIGATVKKTLIEDNQLPQFTDEEIANPSKVKSLVDKLVALGGTYLDNKLEEMGVDPKEYDAAPPSKKKLLMMKAIQQETITRSMAELSGVVPVKSFEAHDKDGNYKVAVAIVASPKFRSFAKEVLESRENVKPNARKVGGPSVRAQILGDKKALLQEFGIRRIYDQDGYPVLISYGQSGMGYAGDNYQKKELYRQASFDHAESQAKANYALLMNAYGHTSSQTLESSVVKDVAKVTLRDGEEVPSEEFSTDMIKSEIQKIEVHGSIKSFPGIRELYRWTITHPENGQEVNGVVYAWSPRSAALAQEMKKTPEQKAAKAPAQPKHEGSAGGNVSKDVMSPNDF
ncbi:DUF6844 domain-containing protein [Oceanidesulfovibrio marinus]|uniref:DUF6844 domain-containing protein n=1 Tax=Oceanidesulfovibrio marinus TaxID=370038 RepID=A0A6P1ZD23_9BACT|nr:hypothetical protein [Oceanidesulfovibrio marinus]TVM32237.1 hypothetical protein DQK91_15250 [Oceanidesulfovibrio marinus]